MFKYNILQGLPWERGIQPDGKNEKMEIYIEEFYTKELKKDIFTGNQIKKMKNYFVALVRLLETMDYFWIVSDGENVMYETKNLEALFSHIDMLKFAVGNH